jgi:hypothetical protein
MLSGLTREEIAAGLDAVVADLLVQAGVAGPPVDSRAVARALGLAVAEDQAQQSRGRYACLHPPRSRPQPAIFVRPEPRGERRHWAVAHEIGEHAAARVFAQLGVGPEETSPKTREAIANQMAGRLLLPTEWFAADCGECGWDLLALKRRYATASHELIARRMLELPVAAIVTIFDQGTLHFRQSNVPGRVPTLSLAERQCWEDCHARNRPHELVEGPSVVRGWPIHEEGWKREILRTEVSWGLVG